MYVSEGVCLFEVFLAHLAPHISLSSKRYFLLGVMLCISFAMQLDPCLVVVLDDPDEIHAVCGFPSSEVQQG